MVDSLLAKNLDNATKHFKENDMVVTQLSSSFGIKKFFFKIDFKISKIQHIKDIKTQLNNTSNILYFLFVSLFPHSVKSISFFPTSLKILYLYSLTKKLS